jgi:hypothetical protein
VRTLLAQPPGGPAAHGLTNSGTPVLPLETW